MAEQDVGLAVEDGGEKREGGPGVYAEGKSKGSGPSADREAYRLTWAHVGG